MEKEKKARREKYDKEIISAKFEGSQQTVHAEKHHQFVAIFSKKKNLAGCSGHNTKEHRRRQLAQVAGKNAQTSHSYSWQLMKLEAQHELLIAVTVFSSKNCWNSRCAEKWDTGMFVAWKRESFEATGTCGAVHWEIRDPTI